MLPPPPGTSMFFTSSVVSVSKTAITPFPATMKYLPSGVMAPARPPGISTILISFRVSTSTTAIPRGFCWQEVKIFESSRVNIASRAPWQLISMMSIGRRVTVLIRVR